ncbi:unnamed protein product [Soboliphyme baturini]|uniref:Myotubularin phosphatase domain-containing protein n=1 Tax=Soboliphyme baturini TaxID=241478 RepID=A0A183JB09_9BILA|nr:unnamed protein product [Soboliphyme baturini]
MEVTFHDGGTLTKANVVPSPSASDASFFRLTTVNKFYTVCQSYPAVLIIPCKISDDSCKKIAKGHKNGR